MNGKGDKLRKGANLKAFRNNYDRIFRKEELFQEFIQESEKLGLYDTPLKNPLIKKEKCLMCGGDILEQASCEWCKGTGKDYTP